MRAWQHEGIMTLKYRKRRYSLNGAESTYLLAIDIPSNSSKYRTALFADRVKFQRPVYSTANPLTCNATN